MLNIAFGLLKDTWENHLWDDALRVLVSLFDMLVYMLIPFVYEVLIKISNATIISGEMVGQIYSRIQLILGVVMVFRLSISVIQYIIEPDTMSDKSKGIGNVIVKILIMLALFTAIVPLHIPKENAPKGSYNAYLRSDGLLFGSLYFFQSRVLETNVIGKLVLGNDSSLSTASSSDNKELAKSGLSLSTVIIKSVVSRKNTDICENTCEDDCPDAYELYDNGPEEIDDVSKMIWNSAYVACEHDHDYYAFTYFPLVGFVVGAFILVALVSFCVDIAMRAIKMAILRLIAPIPILSYIDPKSSEKGAFSNWVKTLTKTYLDMFIRLVLIFFIIFVVKGIAENGIAGLDFEKPADALALVFIIVGLFFFAKQAPQFIYEALGMEYKKGAGIFSGLGKMIGVGAAIGGSIGTAKAYANARREEGGSHASITRNRMLGAASGLFSGLRAAMNADDHQGSAALAAQQKAASRRAAHSTLGGRVSDSWNQMIGGATALEKDEAYIKANKDIADLYDRMTQQADSNGTNKVFGYSYKNAAGQQINVDRNSAKSVKELKENFERLKLAGASTQQLKEAEDHYKAAQEHMLTAVTQGNYSDIVGNVDPNTNSFIDEMQVAYNEASALAGEVDLDLSMGNGQVTGDSFKIQHFTALNRARRRERSDSYTARKSASQYNKK